MSASKHTPGPWRWNGNDIESSNEALPVLIVDYPSRFSISEADKALISAAPELLEALRDLLEVCNSRGAALGLDDGGPVLDKARRSIAHAEAAP